VQELAAVAPTTTAVSEVEPSEIVGAVNIPVPEAVPESAVIVAETVAEPGPALVAEIEPNSSTEPASRSEVVSVPTPEVLPDLAAAMAQMVAALGATNVAQAEPAEAGGVTDPKTAAAPEAPAVVAAESIAAPAPVVVPEIQPRPLAAAAAANGSGSVPAQQPLAVPALASFVGLKSGPPAPQVLPDAVVKPEAPAQPELPQAVQAAAPTPATDATAPDALQKDLWAAAEMVAEAVSAHAVPPPAPPVALPLAAIPPEPAPAPLPVPAPQVVPAFMVNLRKAPDHLQWAVFGGTAAFLGVIWVAIWFAVGK
jgi:hypothetical protein